MRLIVAAGVDEHCRPRVKRSRRILVRRSDRSVAAQKAKSRPHHHEVVRELVEGPIRPEVGAEREREHERVRRYVAPGVVRNQQHRTPLRDVMQTANVGPEVVGGE
jgi:hypothetical protein